MATPSKLNSDSVHPDLPNRPCPQNLFVSLLGKNYLAALYLVEPSIFPQSWRSLIKTSPTAAWNALNTAIVSFLNLRYSCQGLHIGKSENALFNLAQTISDKVARDLQNEESCVKCEKKFASQNQEFDLLLEKLQIVLNIVSNQVTGLTGREVTIVITAANKAIQK